MATLLLAAGVGTSACTETVTRSGLPAGNVATGYDARWHDSFFAGTVEPAEPVPLATLCPGGWSEIRVTPTFPATLLGWVSLAVYTPSVVTVVCASPPGVFVGAPGETPLPPLCR